MKKFFLTEQEKINILQKYYSKGILLEQPNFTFLARLFAKNSADDIAAQFSDDAARTIDGLLSKTFNRVNSQIAKTGEAQIISASGTIIPSSQIKNAIADVAAGRKTAEEVGTQFPRFLADGSEFRDLMVNALKRKRGGVVGSVETTGQKALAQQGSSKLPVGKLGQDFKKLASQSSGWLQVKNATGNMSGWKLHVYADDLDEVAYLYEKLLPVANKHGAGFKLASLGKLESLAKSTVQRGKGVTLYLPSSVVAKNSQREFLSDVQSAIRDYKKTGQISGDRMITDNIGYRYELSKPIDAAKGVDLNQYHSLYKANEGGGHNISGNQDLFR